MPTPFTHLQVAQQLLADSAIPESVRYELGAERSAFLLGNIAADARTQSGLKRADTHFYHYDQPLTDHPWRVMLARYPALLQPHSPAQRAFVAGYVAHLALDEVWTLHMLVPLFFEQQWAGDDQFRFFMLHVILVYMDERDYALLEAWQPGELAATVPADWLPFMANTDLIGWRDFIHQQLAGESQTLAILGKRVNKSGAEFRAVLDSPERLQADLWANVPRHTLEQVEGQMYTFAREQMQHYLREIYTG